MNNRLIEVAFPLKQASLDSVHEKNVRHGHISTLHIWPARRPLAACRAALIATLLPDPGNAEERKKLLEKLGGTVVEVVKKKKLPSGRVEEKKVEETVGGILHWGRESGPDLEWFRQRIRDAYGGRAPKVLDPFAGGGAIPLEAMRLGCEVTAIDINPVAWFILKCTLEYPQKLAGQHRPLPKFALESPEFMEGFFKGTGKLTKKQLERNLQAVQANLFPPPDVDLAWHVRAWGWWVLQRAKAELERFYPVVDGQPTVAYLWARTVTCKNCRATVPMLKTRWLCKKDHKRVLLTMEPKANGTGVSFGVQTDVPVVGGNSAQRREHDKRIGAGTMSRSGATCPCCKAIMTMEDTRFEGQASRLGTIMTAVVVDGQEGKEYRWPTVDEIKLAVKAESELSHVFAEVPFGLPHELLPSKEALGFRVPLYGFDQWQKLFTHRQLLALGTFVKHTRAAREAMQGAGYPPAWIEAVQGYLALAVDRLADRSSTLCRPDPTPTQSGVINTFSRFALPMTWDFIEAVTIEDFSGGFLGATEWVAKVAEQAVNYIGSPRPQVVKESATQRVAPGFDIIVTDPPYYNAIPYSDLMDFFYVWLRRTLYGSSIEIDTAFREPLAPKWDHEKNDGELIDDASRFAGDKAKSKAVYEDGMFRAFQACHMALNSAGRLVIVFAHKQPDAWETLASAIIRAGFVVDGSWPIQTEMGNRTRALSSAALASSVWLVCKKRPETARPGWDNRVMEEMHENIATRLRDFWDAGIRGPDFVWAATGPALEAYSKHPVVRKANEPGQLMTVSEFLRHVRRIVVDFVVGRVLSGNGDAEAVSGLDDVTTYYLLHRHDFQMDDAPIGACILYAVSCGLSDSALADQHDVLMRTGGQAEIEDDAEEIASEAADEAPEEGTGSKVKLKAWRQRTRKSLGYEAPGGRPVPLIDQIHRLMHLWKAGDVIKVDEYLEAKALRRNALFHQLLQALIELAPAGSEERSLLESISNHVVARGMASERRQLDLIGVTDTGGLS
jgi:putative DNA methylase